MLEVVRLTARVVAVVLGLAFVVMAAGSTSVYAKNPYPRKGDSAPHDGVAAARQHAVQGIDVSKYQRDIDWLQVKNAGTRFAFIKATEGGDHLDYNFRDNWDGAKEYGVPRGAYHFVYWCRPAKDQIRWFIRNVPKDPEALPPVLDVEWNHLSRCPRTSVTTARAKMREMLRAFEAHYGKKPIIYTDITFHEEVLEGTTEFDDYPFWIRSVAAKPHVRYENRPWEFWQFTATGRVPGIIGDVDRNAFYGTEKQFQDWKDGRFDIGARRMLKPEPKIDTRIVTAPSQPLPPVPAYSARPLPGRDTGVIRPEPTGRAPMRLMPPGLVPDTTSSIKKAE